MRIYAHGPILSQGANLTGRGSNFTIKRKCCIFTLFACGGGGGPCKVYFPVKMEKRFFRDDKSLLPANYVAFFSNCLKLSVTLRLKKINSLMACSILFYYIHS